MQSWQFRKLSSQQSIWESLFTTPQSLLHVSIELATHLMLLAPADLNLSIGGCFTGYQWCPPSRIFLWVSFHQVFLKINPFLTHIIVIIAWYRRFRKKEDKFKYENGQLNWVRFWWTKMCNNILSAGHHLLLGGLDACLCSANVFSSFFELSSAIKYNTSLTTTL